ncbi:Sulfoacetaldehyde reductase [BD1-7 clade bacterium]|uniref:Sulfoacetaldehyde reductase n=1 Tax=BD1-7 clade bacterium TaxID=2029982 RepID=A0A5S9PSD4_9GAMM|nr:Sulfoacetaldehyde reductase [BD1-7 clade bacterium]
MTDTRLQSYGSKALVTGASSGIGKAFSEHLAAAGFDLILVARRESLLAELADKLTNQYPIQCSVLAVDLGVASDIARLITYAQTQDIGLLILNAGFGFKGCFEEQDYAQLNAMLQVNLMAPTQITHALLPRMKQRQRAGIILTGSIEGEAPFPYSSAYAASKSYIHGLGNSLYAECLDDGVDVLVLSPGSTDTDAPISQGISRDQLVGIMRPETVAAQALHQLGKRPLWIPGMHNRLFIKILRWLPRKAASILAGKGMKKAIEASR